MRWPGAREGELMDEIRQIVAVTWMGLRTIPDRIGTSLVIVIGMACAVGALISILSLSAGFTRTMANAGRPNRAIVLSQGSVSEAISGISRSEAATITDAPGIQKGADGKPIVSAEYVTYAAVNRKSDERDAFATIRGVGPEAFALRPEIKLVSGRMFRPGKHELIVGKAAQSQFVGLAEGDEISLPTGDWTVTGTFESDGDANESELIGDAATLLSALRQNVYMSVTVQLESPDLFTSFKEALMSNPTLEVDVMRETDYYAAQSKFFNILLTIIAYAIGGTMGLGATFGALNAMYTAVSTRIMEIATLRAIGFRGGTVVTSVLVESLLLAIAGALIGAAVAWIAFNGNNHVLDRWVIRLAVTPELVGRGILFACVLGLLGGMFPALRAARLPVAEALRAT